MSEWNCYTYLIGWTTLNKWYYGVQYKKGCKPEDLWTKYYTSSGNVRSLREEFGEPDVVQVRRTFGPDVIKAQMWERKVLTRLKCAKDDKWINRGNWGIDFNPSPEKRARSPECRAKISAARRTWCADPTNKESIQRNAQNAGRKGAAKISQKARERFQDKDWAENVFKASHRTPEYRKKVSEAIRSAYAEGRMKKYYEKIQSEEYGKKITESNYKRFQNPLERKKLSDRHKARLQCPEARKRASEAAKSSTEKRLQNRIIMANLREKLANGGELTVKDAESMGCKSIRVAMRKLEEHKKSRERYARKKLEK